MAFSNSFHSSAKSHSIGSSSALAGAEAHNERDFFSLRYSAQKNHFIVGAAGLADTVKDFINETFQPHVDAYNTRQRRKDRRITDSPFDYFESNKNLDIAVEAIFQIADHDFWARWRSEEILYRRGKEIVCCDYPEEIKHTMDEIFRRQIDAYEHIYETHGSEILAKIETQYNRCQDTLDTFRSEPEVYERFEKIVGMKPNDRKVALAELSEEELLSYDDFQAAYHSLQDIERKQYRERIRAGQLHIKMQQAVGHYDEKSPHAHGISVCWADGYKSGLPSRLAKAVVLNRYALEVIQDRLHEIAEEEVAKHPEIFGQEQLQEKGVGRNMDYSTEQIIRKQNQELLQKTDALSLQRNQLLGANGILKIENADLQAQNTELLQGVQKLSELKNMAEYQAQVIDNDRQLRSLRKTFDDVVIDAQAEGVLWGGVRRILSHMLDNLSDVIEQLRIKIHRVKFFERLHNLFTKAGERQERALEDILSDARRRSDAAPEGRESREVGDVGFD